MQKIFEEIQAVYSSINVEHENILVEQITACGGNVIGLGAGRMGYAMQAFIMRLSHLGINSYMLGDTTLPRVGREDLIIINSSSGNTPSIVLLADLAKVHGATLIVLTSDASSQLSKMADFVIKYDPINTQQLMKTVYEQFSFLFFDHCAHQISDRVALSKDEIEQNHSILE